MLVRLLGSAAGGGVPQWNCSCANCVAARTDSSQMRSQSQLAVSVDGNDWVLVNASPDLRDQLYRSPYLHPDPENGLRNTPVAGVVLTSADLDHILGLLLMREFTPVSIYATESVLTVLGENPFFSMLDRLPGQRRTSTFQHGASFEPVAGLTITPIELPGSFPMHISQQMRERLDPREMTIGLLIESHKGGRMAYLPALPAVTPALRTQLVSCDAVLMDGTFWDEEELQRLQPGTPAASAMGHMPISGDQGSLNALKELHHVRRIYTHINNSNPILADSPERQAVLDAGFEIGYDGMEIEL